MGYGGSDVIVAKDTYADQVNRGAGTDTAHVDPGVDSIPAAGSQDSRRRSGDRRRRDRQVLGLSPSGAGGPGVVTLAPSQEGRQRLNGDVSLPGLGDVNRRVTVAVTVWPDGSGATATANEARPSASVVRSLAPAKVSPCPAPLESQAPLTKTSTR